MRLRPILVLANFLLLAMHVDAVAAQGEPGQGRFWDARDMLVTLDEHRPPVRIGIWDSGVDLALFDRRLARGPDGEPLVRGYNSFKRRDDMPMESLPASLIARRDELNRALVGYDDMDSGVESPAAAELRASLARLSEQERADFENDVGRWSAFAHGTGVADIALAGNERAQIVVARMEWWHGSPPVPCWSRELADLEAASIRDLLAYQVENGVRVVNMSWGRFEASYLRNLEECAPTMSLDERRALARYSVETIRAVLQNGMAAAPNVLFVGAAGNSGTTVEAANPATRFALPNFILVGAVDQSGQVARFTNSGPEISLYANGSRVPSRLPGGMLSHPSGTSMATPNVTNAAAKMLAVNPDLTGAELRALLERTADTNSTGQRLLHTARAVEAARVARTQQESSSN